MTDVVTLRTTTDPLQRTCFMRDGSKEPANWAVTKENNLHFTSVTIHAWCFLPFCFSSVRTNRTDLVIGCPCCSCSKVLVLSSACGCRILRCIAVRSKSSFTLLYVLYLQHALLSLLMFLMFLRAPSLSSCALCNVGHISAFPKGGRTRVCLK